jgi:hypothetical protein
MRVTLAMLCLLTGTVAGIGSAAAALPYGPDTCMTGFVWREAYPNDHVCVLPKIRAQARADNAAAASNVQPGGGPYGPGTCKQGLVWREAQPADHVCVAPGNRDQAKTDNFFAYSRQQAHAGKPVARPGGGAHTGGGTGLGDGGTSGGTHAGGAEGGMVCAERFLCPPEMKMAVDSSGTCMCGRQ